MTLRRAIGALATAALLGAGALGCGIKAPPRPPGPAGAPAPAQPQPSQPSQPTQPTPGATPPTGTAPTGASA